MKLYLNKRKVRKQTKYNIKKTIYIYTYIYIYMYIYIYIFLILIFDYNYVCHFFDCIMHSEIPKSKGHIVARSEDRYCQGTVRVLG